MSKTIIGHQHNVIATSVHVSLKYVHHRMGFVGPILSFFFYVCIMRLVMQLTKRAQRVYFQVITIPQFLSLITAGFIFKMVK